MSLFSALSRVQECKDTGLIIPSKKKKKEKIKAALLFVPLPVSLPIQITQGEIILLSDQLHALVLL